MLAFLPDSSLELIVLSLSMGYSCMYFLFKESVHIQSPSVLDSDLLLICVARPFIAVELCGKQKWRWRVVFIRMRSWVWQL